MNHFIRIKIDRLSLLALAIAIATAQATHGQDCLVPLPNIQNSQIEENVPDEQFFESYLNRDLKQYFSSSFGNEVSVNYELLRKNATQSGAAYPKFYLWVKIIRNNKILDQGAIRIQAVNKTHFEVTDFLTRSEIQREPESLTSVFPALLCPAILDKVKS